VQTRRLHESFEGSYSSLASSSVELSQATVVASGRRIFRNFLILGQNGVFWAMTLVSDMLEGQAKTLSTRTTV